MIGSINQTTQMHQVAALLPEYDSYFSQVYYDGPYAPIVDITFKLGLQERTIMSGHLKQKADEYLLKHGLKNDYRAQRGHRYDLAVVCTDLLLPQSLIDHTRTVFVQEGMTDEMTPWSKFIKALGIPGAAAGSTALNGTANLCDLYCVASEGYKEHFARMGTDPARIAVTGMPNFDHLAQYRHNKFPLRDYVMVATSDIRECYRYDNRKKFIRACVRIAAGRPLLFKLHPNEVVARATAEIRQYAPANALIYTEGNTNEMIANCDELITQYSTVVYVGIALGKKVHSYFDVENLKRLTPEQNNGQSAAKIAELCRQFIDFSGPGEQFLPQYAPASALQRVL